MIYVDTSVVLAHLLAESRAPSELLWRETLVSSRLLQYETWTRIHAFGRGKSHSDAVEQTIGRIAFVELLPTVLERALEPFPVAVRTLDALHLATLEFLRNTPGLAKNVRLATFDERMASAAKKMKIPLFAA